MTNSHGKQPTLNKFGTPFQLPPVDRPRPSPILRDSESTLQLDAVSFLNLSRKIGGELTTMSEYFQRLIAEQNEFLRYAANNRKPSDENQLHALIKRQSTEIESICALTNKNRQSTFFNHLSSVSEGIPAFGWILVSPSPTSYIKEMIDAAQFYSNRVLKDFKEKDSIHSDWVKLWLKLLNDLHSFVKENHPTGLNWSRSVTKTSSSNSRDGLINSINSLGTSVTSHLKKTSDESKTKKIVSTHVNGERPSSSSSSKFVLEGNKWTIENQTNRFDLKIEQTDMKQTVYIYKCSDCFVKINGKVNSIVLDQCRKVDLHFTSVVSLVEFINCRNVKAQVDEQVPTIQIEQTDGCHIYLSKSSINSEFITSKSSEMTINYPGENGEFKEFPIPEQFKSSLKNNGTKLVTIPNETSGV